MRSRKRQGKRTEALKQEEQGLRSSVALLSKRNCRRQVLQKTNEGEWENIMNVNYVHTFERPENAVDRGNLKVNVIDRRTKRPVMNARVEISYTGRPDSVIEELVTDDSGLTPTIALPAPPVEYSMEPQDSQPYSEYNVKITASGYVDMLISGSEIFSGVSSTQQASLGGQTESDAASDVVVIPANTLFGTYPPKIPENEIQPVNTSGEIVLSKVVVPETVVVHDGVPADPTASDYYVRYSDYIKNVASSEIYSTWPVETIKANVLAIMSFTLNRVYTEFYRNKGYEFTITSSTAFDHKWIPERNIFEPISVIVDELFADYLSRPNVRQPILTQYCDGQRVSCPNWMTQWGSKYLADQGYSTIEILRYYYGSSMYINTADEISGVPASWPGSNLEVGSTGDKVRMLQEQLNRIARNYPALPTIAVDGIYGSATKAAVEKFQSIFGLPVTGIVDFRTWYRISEIYVAVSRIAELYQ